jgi:hypothetical protein
MTLPAKLMFFLKKILALGEQKRRPKPPYDFKVSHQHNYPQALAGELQTSTDIPQKYTRKKGHQISRQWPSFRSYVQKEIS